MLRQHTSPAPEAVAAVPGSQTPEVEGRKERIILRLVAEMERRNIPYVVMRNHEAYPAFGHDADFAIHTRDIARWQECLVELAQELGWDALTRCHHWDSKYPHQSPKSFLLYNLQPDFDFLCVDLFHGATLWGLPLFTTEEVLSDRVLDERGFYRMAPERETFMRLLQVDALVGRHREQDKVEAYTQRIAAWWPMCGEQTLRLGRGLLGPAFETAARLLLQGDLDGFKRRMKIARLTFLARNALRHPLASFDQARARSKGRLREVGAGQCGFVISATNPSAVEQELLQSALEIVRATNAFREWTAKAATHDAVTSCERDVMQQGGLAVKWTNPRGAHQELDRAAFASPERLASNIFTALIYRHEILWRAAGLAGAIQAATTAASLG